MKKAKKIIACLLCIVLAVSALSVTSFADVVVKEPECTSKYWGWNYCDFGDSISAGYDRYTHGDVVGYVEVPGSYPQLVGSALGMVHFPYSCIGFRTSELLLSLGGGQVYTMIISGPDSTGCSTRSIPLPANTTATIGMKSLRAQATALRMFSRSRTL